MIGWDHPATAESYERFCRMHRRYRRANDILVHEAEIPPGARVLDFGAGSGRTATSALRRLGPGGTVVCVEPATAMRAAGRKRIRDPRVTWRAELPDDTHREQFDRVLAGAVVWQLESLDDWLARAVAVLRPGGALAFNVPALYLGEPDEPGGGVDPSLLDLMASLASEHETDDQPPLASVPRGWCHTRDDVETSLCRAGLHYRAWEFRHRLTQVAYARWLSIPVVTDRLLASLAAAERTWRIERALAAVDRDSFKWERWRGWTAWKL
jgi:SAM-dependent methyltransferase